MHLCSVPKVSAKLWLQVLHWFCYLIGYATVLRGGGGHCVFHLSHVVVTAVGDVSMVRKVAWVLQDSKVCVTRPMSWPDTETLTPLDRSLILISVCLLLSVCVSFFTIITNLSKQCLLSRWRWNELQQCLDGKYLQVILEAFICAVFHSQEWTLRMKSHLANSF